MGYGFSEKTSTSGGGSYLDEAGIYNAKLAAVVYENSRQDGAGKMVLAFRFETEEGKSFRHIEWDIDEAKTRSAADKVYDNLVTQGKAPKESKPQFQQNFLDREYEQQGVRIKHIAEAYQGGQGAIGGRSYEEFARNVSSAFKQLDTSEYKPLLVVYNAKDYASLPRYTPFFGVSREILEKKATKEKMTKVVRDSEDEYGGTSPAPQAGDDEF